MRHYQSRKKYFTFRETSIDKLAKQREKNIQLSKHHSEREKKKKYKVKNTFTRKKL